MGILDNLNLKGSAVGGALNSIDSMRPHILGDLLPQTSTSSIGASLKNLTGILSERPQIFKARISSVQSAPTILDKVHSLVVPPGFTPTPSGTSGDVATQTVPSGAQGHPYEYLGNLTFH